MGIREKLTFLFNRNRTMESYDDDKLALPLLQEVDEKEFVLFDSKLELTKIHHHDNGNYMSDNVTFWFIFGKAFPLSIGQIFQSCQPLIMLIFAGHLSLQEMAAVALSVGLINVTGFACGSGFCSALDTVLSYTHGLDPESKMYGIFTQRLLIILILASLPLMFISYHASVIIQAFGQTAAVTQHIADFCHIASFAIFPMMSLELLRRYLVNQNITKPLFWTPLATGILNPLLLFILAPLFRVRGIALTWLLLTVFSILSYLSYLIVTGEYKRTWGGWDLGKATTDLWPLLRLSFSSMGLLFGEWIAVEIVNIAASFGTAVDLASFAIVTHISAILWGICSGFFFLTSALVGQKLGENNPQGAATVTNNCLLLTFGSSLLNSFVIIKFRGEIPKFFTEEPEVIEMASYLLIYLAVYHVLDVFQSFSMSIFRGCGLTNFGMIVINLVYYAIGIPVGILLFLKSPIGVESLLIGPIIGMLVLGIPIYIYRVWIAMDWSLVAEERYISQCSLDSSNKDPNSIYSLSAVDPDIYNTQLAEFEQSKVSSLINSSASISQEPATEAHHISTNTEDFSLNFSKDDLKRNTSNRSKSHKKRRKNRH